MATKDKSSAFAISLEDETSVAALQAAGSLEQLQRRIEADTKALGAMQKAMRNVKGGALSDVAAFNSLKSRVEALKASIASSQAAFVNAGGSFQAAAKPFEGSVASFGGGFFDMKKEIAAAQPPLVQFLTKVASGSGPLSSMASKALELGASLTNPIALANAAVTGILALVAAIATFVVAVGAATIALAQYGLAQANARRAELLHLEGLTTLRTAYQRQRETGAELQASIDRVSDSSALGRAELSSMAQGLYRAGLRGRDLTDTLDGLSIAQSVQGDRGAARFRAMAISAARTGGSVRALADDVRSRLGPIATRQALTWDRQIERLHEAWGHLFDGISVEGPLTVLHEIVSTFSQSTATGRGLRAIITAIFRSFGGDATSVASSIHHLFLLGVVGALRLTVAVLRVRNMIRDAFSAHGTEGAGEAIGDAISNGILKTNWLALGGRAVLGILRGIGTLQTIRDRIYLALAGFVVGLIRSSIRQYTAIGSSIVDGIVGGVTSGVARLRAAVTGLAGSATSALTSVLEIHSPSRVFAGLGAQIPRGLAEGVESGSGAASEAVATMGGGLVDRVPLGGATSMTSSSTSIGPFYLTVTGANAREQAENLRDQVADIFEELALRRGAT